MPAGTGAGRFDRKEESRGVGGRQRSANSLERVPSYKTSTARLRPRSAWQASPIRSR